MKTILKITLILAIAALLAPMAISAEKNDSLAIKNKISTQNAGEEQQLQIQNREQTQKGTPADSGQGQKNQYQNKEQTKTQTKAQYKDEDGNGVGDQNKLQKKEQKKTRTRTRAKKQTGECNGNMVPQDGGSGNRQGQGSGSGTGNGNN